MKKYLIGIISGTIYLVSLIVALCSRINYLVIPTIVDVISIGVIIIMIVCSKKPITIHIMAITLLFICFLGNIINWLIQGIAEPSNLFRIFAVDITSKAFPMALSQTASIIGIIAFVVLCLLQLRYIKKKVK